MVSGRQDGHVYDDRPGSAMSNASDESQNEDMWQNMLSSVASSKRLPQKTIVVLGGSAENQRDFVDSLYSGKKRGDKKPPVANQFALGYTYLDVLDPDHEDVLARLGVYLVSEPQPAFTPLLKPLFTPASLPDTLLCILLDWRTPWDWTRQLRTWVRLLRGLFTELDDDSRRTLDEVTHAWEQRRSTYADTAGSTTTEVRMPLGPGEFDEPIGLPLCVICQNADKIELLEKERGWKEDQFDFILQFLRTILLKHGASLIYTIPNAPSSLQPLIFSLLSIQSTLRNNTIKHNIIDRDKVLVPPGWDSWGKIRILREGFDVEGINNGWSVDVSHGVALDEEVEGGAVEVYEDVIKDTSRDDGGLMGVLNNNKGVEVAAVDTQGFLAQQLELLETRSTGGGGRGDGGGEGGVGGHYRNSSNTLREGGVRDHVGPVQFNMGGIQMDADDMLQGSKARESSRPSELSQGEIRHHNNPASTSASSMGAHGSIGPGSAVAGSGGAGSTSGGEGGRQEEAGREVLSAFFNTLLRKGGRGGRSDS